jgi:O-glycosyl hydrolase
MLRIDLNILALSGPDGDLATPVNMVEDIQANIDAFDWNSVPTKLFGGIIEASKTKKLDSFKVIGSIWTPPHWMKGEERDEATGQFNGKLPEIKQVGQYLNSNGGSLIDTPANLEQFGRYVAAYVKGYEQKFGVPLYAISIQNELAFSEPYNSAVYDPALYVKALKAVASSFDHYGITTKLIGPEDVGVGSTSNPWVLKRQMNYIDAIRADADAKAALDVYAIHGYADDGVTDNRSPAMWSQYWNGRPQSQYPNPANAWWTGIKNDAKASWMTETSGQPHTWDGALSLAASAQDALVQGNVSAWVYWQSTSGNDRPASSGDLMAAVNTSADKYQAAQHFFRYIRPDARRVSATPTDPNGVYASAFVHDANKTLTAVLVNVGSTAQTVNLKLDGTNLSLFNIARQSSATSQWSTLGAITVTNNVATLSLPAKSIITLQGVTQAATTQTPYLGTPFVVGSSAVTIQTENFDNGGESVAYHDLDATNRGGKYRTSGVDIESTTDLGGGYDVGYVKSGEWLEYTIDVQQAATYDLTFRVAAAAAGGKFHVDVGGVNKTGALSVPNTGGWQTWSTVTKTGVSLSAGKQILRIAMDANGSTGSVGNFNWLRITKAATTTTQTPFKGTPFVVVSGAVATIQAEDFDNGGEGVAYHDLESANQGGAAYRSSGVDIQSTTDTGGGYNVGYTKAGEWLEYTIDVQSAGAKTFAFRVASAASGGRFHAEIDGVDVTGSLSVPNTGGYQKWMTVTKTGVNLTPGLHVLRLRMDANGSSGSVGNFNWIRIS